MENQRDLFFDAVDDDVLAHGKATQARAQILLAAASDVRVAGEEIETLANRIDEPVGSLDAAAFFGHVIPDTLEFGFCFRCDTVRHQREGDCSAARRARPRCFTSSASCRIDSCVIVRPPPAREGSLPRVNRSENFRAGALPLFPQGKSLL